MNYNDILGIKEIKTFDFETANKAKKQWDSIAKPLFGLGRFEEIIIKIAGITGDSEVNILKKAVVVMCSDNGIVEEGVTQTDKSVTKIVAENIANGVASVAKMAQNANADVFAVDIGIASDTDCNKILHKKISYGTHNFLKQPAMSEEEVIDAIKVGIEIVKNLKDKGYSIIATGEMGIGNTTTSSAMASTMLNLEVEKTTGRGAGLDDNGFKRKKEVILSALNKYHLNQYDTLNILKTVGGLDIAGLVGVFIGGAIYRIPIVIDGLITAIAALAAARIIPEVKDILLASHIGREPAIIEIMKELELEPIINADLALGEGTGAVLLFPLLDMVMRIYSEKETFEKFNIDAYEDYGAKL